MLKLLLSVLLLGFSTLVWADEDVDYDATRDRVEEEEEAGQQDDIERIQLSSDVLIFPHDTTNADLETGFETGVFNTTTSLREGGQPADQALMRMEMAQWHRQKFGELRRFNQDLAHQAEQSTKFADEDPSNAGFDVVDKLTQLDEMLHGPKHEKADPAFAKGSSTSLNPAPDPSSQQGDPCQDNTGNGASMGVAPMGAVYSDACSGSSYAEILDCTKETIKRINSESKSSNCNSTQVMEPTKPKVKNELGEVDQAQTNTVNMPSCPTTPREAETVIPDAGDLVASQRNSFQQNALVQGRGTTAYASLPDKTAKAIVQLEPVAPTMLGRFLAWFVPNTMASTGGVATNFRSETSALGVGRDIQNEKFNHFIDDLEHHAALAGAQDMAKKTSQMMEEFNKLQRANLEENEMMRESLEEIANASHLAY